MSVRMRTVIFQNSVEIGNVPILSCDSCNRSEILPAVKPELTGLIGQLGSKPGKRQLYFDEVSELAHLLIQVSSKERVQDPVEHIIEERINELLDLMLLARSLGDQLWIGDIRKRLKQLTQHAMSAQDIS